MTKKWSSYRDVPLLGHLYVADQQKKKKKKKQSGMKFNESKTDLFVFHRKNEIRTEINVGNQTVSSKPTLNIFGIKFDSLTT